MSLNAHRYRCYGEETRVQGSPYKMTSHHVPPRNPDKVPRTIRIDERHHRAYHLLFGSARSLDDAISILTRDWWSP